MLDIGENPQCRCDATVLSYRRRSYLVYNEPAFHSSLRFESGRARRSSRPLLLVLLHLPAIGSGYVAIPSDLSIHIVRALSECIRDLDLIGWYRERQVIAAVLSDIVCPDRTALHLLRTRLREAIDHRLPTHMSRSIRTHIWLVGSGPTGSHDRP